MASTALRNEPDEYVAPTYEGDYAGWAFHQAMLVRSGQFQLLDRAWVAEELDGLARQEFDRLASALRLILQHMLKWDFQTERRSRSWTVTIGLQRDVAEQQILDNPSLKPRRAEAIARVYKGARRLAASETDLPLKTFPPTCPYTWDEIMTRPFVWPGDEE